jgi:hypothetical protein
MQGSIDSYGKAAKGWCLDCVKANAGASDGFAGTVKRRPARDWRYTTAIAMSPTYSNQQTRRANVAAHDAVLTLDKIHVLFYTILTFKKR